MKKITALTAAVASYLSLIPAKAFAAAADQPAIGTTGINLCPPNNEGFDILCGGLEFGGLVGTLIQLAFVLAVVIALAFLIWGGIQWILSGGDKGKVEGARGTIVAALVGLVLVFLSYFILNIILNFFTNADINNLQLPSLIK